ncbi:MAG: hypothetical protein V1891_00775 [bacterium]
MRIEIDQSNKIEQTNKDTVIGLSNGKVFTVVISRQIKRRMKEEFRMRGKQNLFKYRCFIAGVVLMIKYAKIERVSIIVIDKEYYGKEIILKSMFLEMWSRYFSYIPDIIFDNIGKKSNAHIAAYHTMKGKYAFDKKLDFYELSKLCL